MDPLKQSLIPQTPSPEADADSEMDLIASSSPSQSDHGMPRAQSLEETGGKEGGEGSTKPKRKRKERVTWAGVSEEGGHRKLPKKTRHTQSTNVIIEEEHEDPSDLHSYNLFEEGYGLRSDSRTTSREQSRTTSREPSRSRGGSDETHSSFSQSEGVIDGRFSITSTEILPDFVRVEAPTGYGEDSTSTTANLEICKRTVLNPYLYFLKAIGWRRIRGSRHDLELPITWAVFNIVYPAVIFILLLLGCCTQIVTCFSRDQPVNQKDKNDRVIIECEDHFFTRLLLPDTLLLTAYLWGLYIFRYGDPEHLATLIETVFLSYSSRHVRRSQKGLITVLVFILVGGLLWVIFSLCVSILRIFSLQLLEDKTYIDWLTIQNIDNATGHTTTEDALRYSFVIFTVLGFVFFDLLYIAVVISYASQGQLLVFYVLSIIDKVRTKAYRLGGAIKDIKHAYDFLKVMNGKVSILTTLCLFIFIQALMYTIYDLYQLNNDMNQRVFYFGVAVGLCNITQWTILTFLPIIQAARVTATCRQLRRLGLEIGSRPYIYSDTPQLVLDSFLQYTDATEYTAKLASIPIYPSYVVGFLFIFGLIATFLISTYPVFTFQFVKWF